MIIQRLYFGLGGHPLMGGRGLACAGSPDLRHGLTEGLLGSARSRTVADVTRSTSTFETCGLYFVISTREAGRNLP
jgi:hypothetical protein